MIINKKVYVVCYYPVGISENNPMRCTNTFAGACIAVDNFILENEEEWQDTDYNLDNEWRIFTNKGTYVITRMPLYP